MYYLIKKKKTYNTQVYNSTKLEFDICTIAPPWKLQVDKIIIYIVCMGFPGNSVVKNPLTNAGDKGDAFLIPGSGRSPAERNG